MPTSHRAECIFILVLAVASIALAAPPETPAEAAFARLKSLAGVWEADSPAGGKLTTTLVLVSKGTAIEETIGTPADNEVSLYTAGPGRITMTHYCALTPSGNQARLEAPVADSGQREFLFAFIRADNLAPEDAHMRRMELRLADATHFTEVWTMHAASKDTVITLNFTPRK